MIRSLPRAPTRDPLPAVAAAVIAAVAIAPWALGFSASHAAVASHIAFAMTFGPIALLITALPAAALTSATAGAWLITSPWALGYSARGPASWSADVVAGLLLIALAVCARRAAGATTTPARQHRRPRARRS